MPNKNSFFENIQRGIKKRRLNQTRGLSMGNDQVTIINRSSASMRHLKQTSAMIIEAHAEMKHKYPFMAEQISQPNFTLYLRDPCDYRRTHDNRAWYIPGTPAINFDPHFTWGHGDMRYCIVHESTHYLHYNSGYRDVTLGMRPDTWVAIE